MSETFRYPLNNIGSEDDYFKIQVVEYKAPGLNLTGGFGQSTSSDALSQSIQTSVANIILPMPSTIQDSNAADWQSGTMNPIASYLASGGLEAIQSKDFASSLGGSVLNLFQDIGSAIKTGEGQSGTAAAATALALKAALGQGSINQIVSRATGQVFNENVELLFNGVTLRPAFNFTFDIVPRSKSESNQFKSMIKTLKTNMSPRKGKPGVDGGGLFVKAPNVFKLSYMSGGNPHPFLHSFKPCALKQMSVNYNGSGQYATYSDATPVHMQLTLQFQELTPIYAEDYEGDSTGVGF